MVNYDFWSTTRILYQYQERLYGKGIRILKIDRPFLIMEISLLRRRNLYIGTCYHTKANTNKEILIIIWK